MKGFIFSIEAILTITVVIIAISAYALSTTPTISGENNSLEIQTQSQAMMTQYFGLDEQAQNVKKTEQICQKVPYFDYEQKTLEEKEVCN